MATKKKVDAQRQVFGVAALELPAEYVIDARHGTLSATDYKGLNKGTERMKLAAALREAADVLEQDAGALPVAAGVTPASLRQQAFQLETDDQVARDLGALTAHMTELRQLNMDASMGTANEFIAQIKTTGRRNTTLKERFPKLVNLHKRDK